MPLNDYSYHFERFWKEYRLKVGKGAAWKIWQKLVKGEDEGAFADMLVAHLSERNQVDAKWIEGKYIPQPATFLNQARWDDDYKRVRKTAPSHQPFKEEESFSTPADPETAARYLAEAKRQLH